MEAIIIIALFAGPGNHTATLLLSPCLSGYMHMCAHAYMQTSLRACVTGSVCGNKRVTSRNQFSPANQQFYPLSLLRVLFVQTSRTASFNAFVCFTLPT